MPISRHQELKYLNTYYKRPGSQIIVMYGNKGIGKKALIEEFLVNKPHDYYKARPASEREQLFRWGSELSTKLPKYPDYNDIFNSITEGLSTKKVLIIDDFQFFVKSSPSFMPKIIELAHGRWNSGQVLIILLSSQIGWIENSMVEKVGEHAYELSGFLKVKELNFYELYQKYSDLDLKRGIETYSILGGNPGMWQYFDLKLSAEKNICRNILPDKAYLRGYAERIVADELRETGVYNTILAAIAEGNNKLNDLYLHTAFSRAKISVYIKNLMELALVEKVYSTPKNYYRITNHFVHFYFTYLYPHLSDLSRMDPQSFFNSHIAPTFKSYVAGYFKMVCISKLETLNQKEKLPPGDFTSGFSGRDAPIDIFSRDETGKTLIGFCNWEKPIMTYDDYEWLLFCAAKLKIKADYIFLFSAGRFDEKLNLEAKVKQNIRLIGVDKL